MAVVRQNQNFPPPQTPFPGAQDANIYNQLERRWSLPAPTDPVWWRSMHAISSYRGNRHRPPATNSQTHRQNRLQYTTPLAGAQCNKGRRTYRTNFDEEEAVQTGTWVPLTFVVNIFSGPSSDDDYLGHSKNHDWLIDWLVLTCIPLFSSEQFRFYFLFRAKFTRIFDQLWLM